jgi:hypothetical protein
MVLSVLRDVTCGVLAYAASRWVFKDELWSWENLAKEVAAFLGLFLVLRVVAGLWGRAVRRRREARRIAVQIRNVTPPARRT